MAWLNCKLKASHKYPEQSISIEYSYTYVHLWMLLFEFLKQLLLLQCVAIGQSFHLLLLIKLGFHMYVRCNGLYTGVVKLN